MTQQGGPAVLFEIFESTSLTHLLFVAILSFDSNALFFVKEIIIFHSVTVD